eukprot:5440358-Pyramimonas_sp.AAC.1
MGQSNSGEGRPSHTLGKGNHPFRASTPLSRGPPDGVVTTPRGESVGTRGHCTVLGLGPFSPRTPRATGVSEVPRPC